MKRIRLFALLSAQLLSMLLCALPSMAESGDDQAEWTVMFYMCGSDLESRYGYASENLKEIAGCMPYFNLNENELLPGDWNLVDETDRCGLDSVNVVFETGGCRQWHTKELGMDVKTSALQRWHFPVNTESGFGDYILDETLPLQSMADPETLSDFIRWGAANYPAKKYALVLWDHGGGSKSGLLIDELFMGDMLYLDELGAALRSSDVHLECLLLDACMMANVETVCAVGDSASWLVASEEVVGGKGTAVGEWMQQLCYIPEMDGETLGRLICDTTQMKYAREEDETCQEILTWSVVDLSQAERLKEVFDRIFAELGRMYVENPIQLNSLLNTCIEAERYGSGNDGQLDLGDSFFLGSETTWNPALRREVLKTLKDSVAYCVRGSARCAARGLSYCNPFNFSCDEMEVYVHNCPSPHFLALLDAISPWTAPEWVYEKVERLPEFDTVNNYLFKVRKFFKPDGTPVFDFVNDGSRDWFESNVMRYNLYKEEEDGTIIKLGTMPVKLMWWDEDEEFLFAFGVDHLGLWPAMEDAFCYFEVLSYDRPGWSTCSGRVFARINGEHSELRCSYNAYDDIYTVYGVWAGFDLQTGMFNRNVRSLAQLAGRELTLIFPINEPGEFDIDDYYIGKTMKLYRVMEMSSEPLPEGDYYIEYEIYDLFMRPMPMEKVKIHWDGTNVILADGYTWEGEELLKVPDEFW